MSFNSQPEHQHQSEAELMDGLLAASTIEYPWNPGDPDTADYYAQTDRHFSLDDWSDAEIAQKSQSLYARIESAWETIDLDATASSLATLTTKFGTRVPHQWLAQIAANVSKIATSNLEPVDRLVGSVQDLLANWATEDLLVMARPYAFAMRCDLGVDDPDKIVRPLAWAELSELERAKLTILIAQYAIDAL
jgi:hypothetical protein